MSEHPIFHRAWQAYNADDSFLPFYIPLTIWVGTFAYCKVLKKREFHKWLSLHNTHNVIGILLGLLSLYFKDDNVFSERIPILWSVSYFLVDVIDCVMRFDGVYTAHATCCLVLGISNYTTPVSFALRMNSKATLVVLSNPFMHFCKKTRNPLHFLLFCAVFTCCRIIWIPVMMRQLTTAGLPLTDVRLVVLAAFYGLNCFWYVKMLKIAVQGGERGSKDKKDEKKE